MATRSRNKLAKASGQSSSGSLKFPLDVNTYNSYIQFRRIPGPGTGSAGSSGRVIQLYMPAQPTEANSATYATDSIVVNQILGGQTALEAGTSITDLFKSAIEGDSDALKKLGKMGLDAAKVRGAKSLQDSSIGNIAESQLRQTLNPALTYLFKTMNHRTFTFTFDMKATSEPETTTIRNIIKEFKSIQAPLANSGDRFLRYPDSVDVKYKNDSFLHKFKEAVIKDVNVTYNTVGGAQWSQFKNTAPLGVRLDITIEELTTITRQDVDDGNY